MNTVVDNAVCRCCSSEGAFKNIKGKYIWMGEEETYIDMLKDCYDIQIIIPEKLNHDLESGICELCITQLRNALNFRKQVLTTEEVFRKRFSDKIQLCESNCIKIEEPSDGLHDDDDGVVDALDFDINVSEVHEYEVPVKEEESEGEVSRSKRSKRTTRSSTIKIKRSKLDRAETSKCDSKKNDEKLQQKVKHLIKKKSKIKSEQDDDWTVSISKKADSDQGEQSGSLVGTVVKFLKPTKGNQTTKIATIKRVPTKRRIIELKPRDQKAISITTKKFCEVDKHHNNLSMVLKHSNATPIRSRAGIGFRCCFCESEFPLARDLKQHTIKTHDDDQKSKYMKGAYINSFLVKMDITDLRCDICALSVTGLDELMAHLKEAHGKNIYMGLNSYIVPFRFQEDRMYCVVCSVEHTSFKVMLAHMNDHIANFTCNECGMGFINKKILHTHCYRHRKGDFKCMYCPKIFDSKPKMLAHIRAVHFMSNMRSKCGYCGEMFKDHAGKVEHEVAVHGAKKIEFRCNACTDSFSKRRALTNHVKRYHLMEKK